MSETDPIDPLQLEEETVVIGENSKTAMEESLKEYNNSPVISNPWSSEDSRASSTAFWVQYYGEYKLQAQDIESWDYNHFTNQPQYSLCLHMLMAVQITINELQAALTIAATMTPTRLSWFQVNLKDMFMTILKSTNKVQLLNATWKGLAGRLARGHQFLQKYSIGYERQGQPASPTSTISDL